MTLSDLPSAYTAARAEASSGKPVVEDIPPDTCRYCGKYLHQWPNARIDGHAKCIVPLAFQRAVYNLWRTDHRVTMKAVAEACGVSLNTVYRWKDHVERMGWCP